jgi:hypothetical protein
VFLYHPDHTTSIVADWQRTVELRLVIRLWLVKQPPQFNVITPTDPQGPRTLWIARPGQHTSILLVALIKSYPLGQTAAYQHFLCFLRILFLPSALSLVTANFSAVNSAACENNSRSSHGCVQEEMEEMVLFRCRRRWCCSDALSLDQYPRVCLLCCLIMRSRTEAQFCAALNAAISSPQSLLT